MKTLYAENNKPIGSITQEKIIQNKDNEKGKQILTRWILLSDKKEEIARMSFEEMDDSEVIFLASLKVKENFRGKGIGTALMLELIHKNTHITLDALYPKAVDFYKKLGLM